MEVILFDNVVFIGYLMINDTVSLQTPAGFGSSPRKGPLTPFMSIFFPCPFSVSYCSRGSCVSGQYLALVCG